MNRDIGFRGKRTDNGEWVYGGCFQSFRNKKTGEIDQVCIAETGSPVLDALVNIGDGKWVEYNSAIWHGVDPETVGQYTGLHDSKRTEEYPEGQKIYEGDVLYYTLFDPFDNDTQYKGVVRYDEQCAVFICDTGEDNGTTYSGWILQQDDAPEVIGNIHDNPELMKEGE